MGADDRDRRKVPESNGGHGMRNVSGWIMRIAGLFNKGRNDREFQEELESHIQMHMEDNLRSGMTPEEARRQAMIKIGGIESTKEACRDQRGVPWLENLVQDVRYGARQLLKNPGFAAVAVLTLALGIGANTAVFSVVNAVILRPLPYENPGQLVGLWSDMSGKRTDRNQFCPADITDFREQVTTFEDIGVYDQGLSANLTGGAEPERVNGSEASPGLFTTLRVKPILGRTFLSDETDIAQSKVALISEGLWKRRFGGDPGLAGRKIQLDGESFTIVGVLPSAFKFPEHVDLWLPFSFTAADWRNDRDHYYVEVVGRLKTGISFEQARAELETVGHRMALKLPNAFRKWGITLVPMQEQIVGKISSTLWILFGAVSMVLLIACVNVASLLLTRATARQKEITVRVALGAGWVRIVKQLLTEALMLGLMGGVAGTLIACGVVKLFAVSSLNTLPQTVNLTVSWPVLAFTILISVVTGVVCGLTPALSVANPNINSALKDSGRTSSHSRSALRNFMVVAEIALSLVLLVGGGLLINSFIRLRTVPTGYDPRNVLTLQVTLPKKQYPDTERQNAFLQRAFERIQSLPGVKSVAATINPPLLNAWGMGYFVPDHENSPTQIADNAYITPNYFHTMGISMLKGRDFLDADSTKGPPVIIINQAMARKHFPDENPIGKRIQVGGGDREIVGVVADVKTRGLELVSNPMLYLPYSQKLTIATFLTFVVSTKINPLSLAGLSEKEITDLDRNLPVADVQSMEQIVSASLAQRRLTMLLLGAFAVLALLLASIGIYGLLAYSVSQRSREMGIRVALGAQQNEVLTLIIGEGMKLALAGAVIGLAGALALSRLMRSLLYEVTPSDPATFCGVSILLLAVALIACWLPARRAGKVDPMVALRHE